MLISVWLVVVFYWSCGFDSVEWRCLGFWGFFRTGL